MGISKIAPLRAGIEWTARGGDTKSILGMGDFAPTLSRLQPTND